MTPKREARSTSHFAHWSLAAIVLTSTVTIGIRALCESTLATNERSTKRRLLFSTGHGELVPTNGFENIAANLEERFESVAVDFSSENISAEADVVVVGGPERPFDEKALRGLDRAIRRARGAVILAPSARYVAPAEAEADRQLGQLQANFNGLEALLAAYGFRIAREVVMDPENAVPGIVENRQGRQFLYRLPQVIGIFQDASARELGPGIAWVFASPVALVGPLAGSPPPTASTLWRIAFSSAGSWLQPIPAILPKEPSDEARPPSGRARGAQVLGYVYEGPLGSPFAEKSSPARGRNTTPSPTAKAVRLVVIGSSLFVRDDWVRLSRIFPIYKGGLQRLVDLIMWIAGA